LIATPATVFSENTNPVSYFELLSYARRISKFTKPPTLREIDVNNTENGAATIKIDIQKEATPEVKTNGSTTPVVANGMIGGSSNGDTGAATPIETLTALPEGYSLWLNPLNDGLPFVPWPAEETIRRGALASIQILLDQGTDPATFDPEKSAELEAERQKLEEEAEIKKAQEEQAKRERDQRAREEMQRRQSVGTSLGGATRQENKPAKFQMLDLDMDEDDD
jgi:hypothetical protein